MRRVLRRFVRGLGWLLAGLLALAVCARVYIQLNLDDEPLREDAAFLALSDPPPPEVVVPLTRVADALAWNDEEHWAELGEHIRSEAWGEAFVERALRENAAALEAWDAALEHEELSLPGFDRATWQRAFEEAQSRESPESLAPTEDFESILRVQIAAKLVRLDAERLAQRGEAGAFERALELLCVSNRIARPANVVELMTANAISFHGLQAVAAVTTRTELAPGEATSWVQRIDALRPSPVAWRAGWSAEYRRASWMMRASVVWADRQPKRDRLRRLALPDEYLFQLNAQLNSEREFYSRLAAASTDPCSPQAARRERPRTLRELARYVGPNVGGRILSEIAHPTMVALAPRRCVLHSRFSMAQALVALRAFHTEHGQLPDSLDALVPTYLDSVPRDWLGGGPIRYDRDRKRLWSIGRDFRDAGRVPEDPNATRWGDDSEPVLPIDF